MRFHRSDPRPCTVSLVLAVAGTFLVAACATTSLDLDRARDSYEQAAGDSEVARNAPVALYEAEQELKRTERAWLEDKDRDETAHRAYLTEKRIEIARAVAAGKAAREEGERLNRERSKVLLEARTREVGKALSVAEQRARDAELARLEAEARAAEAERMRQEAQAAADEARRLQQAIAELEAHQTERGIVLTLGDVLFDFDQAALKPGAEQNLLRLVEFLEEYPDREVLVEGHTDSVGSNEYNLSLSRRRADVVHDFLTRSGIPAARVVTKGYGRSHPVLSNDTAEGRQRNRRVEVVILDAGGRAVDEALPAVGSPPPDQP